MQLRRFIIVIAALEFSLALSAYAAPLKPEVSWEVLFSKQGVLVERGLVADSPYHAIRGTGIVQSNVGRVISILFDHTHANQWIYKLVAARGLRDDDQGTVVWQRFNSPWPVKDRAFVYIAKPTFDREKKYFRALFSDITDTNIVLTDAERSRNPEQSCCVVGKIIYTEWQFRPTGRESTCVRVEVIIDPKGLVPDFLINLIQRKWTYLTIKGLEQQVKEDINLHEEFGNWVAERPEIMISDAECMRGTLED